MKKFISLFSGAGGLDQGFINAGWEPYMMIDSWQPAINTLIKNHKAKIIKADLSNMSVDTLNIDANITCIIGGPPCQAYSRLNQNQLFQNGVETEQNLNDPRRSLFMDFLRIVDYVKPPFMVMENVFDLKTRKLGGTGIDKDKIILDVILEEMDKVGYNVLYNIMRAQDFNVPQMRKRLIFIGVRKDIDIAPSFPLPRALETSVINEFSKISLDDPNQERKNHSLEWVNKINHITQGGYYNHLPLEYKALKQVNKIPVEYNERLRMVTIDKNHCIRTISGNLLQGEVSLAVFKLSDYFQIKPRMGTYLRRIKETVSHTVTRNPLIHPTENREITVREKASIQTFPSNYCFVGTTQEQHILVGNAVPCNLGKAIAEHIGQWHI